MATGGPATAGYKDFATTGGWTPEMTGAVGGDIADWKNFASGATISPEDRARMRGGGVYDEFAKTGGYSAGDIANIRSRGTSGVPAFYSTLQEDLERQNAATGGYAPGFGSQMAKLAREQAHGAQSAALDTELGIKEKVNEGRRWGATGMTSSETGLQDLLARNFLGGMQGAAGERMGMYGDITRGQLAGLGGLSQEDQNLMGNMLQAYVSGGKMNQDAINSYFETHPEKKPLWQQILGTVVGGAAAGLTGGGGGFIGKLFSRGGGITGGVPPSAISGPIGQWGGSPT